MRAASLQIQGCMLSYCPACAHRVRTAALCLCWVRVSRPRPWQAPAAPLWSALSLPDRTSALPVAATRTQQQARRDRNNRIAQRQSECDRLLRTSESLVFANLTCTVTRRLWQTIPVLSAQHSSLGDNTTMQEVSTQSTLCLPSPPHTRLTSVQRAARIDASAFCPPSAASKPTRTLLSRPCALFQPRRPTCITYAWS